MSRESIYCYINLLATDSEIEARLSFWPEKNEEEFDLGAFLSTVLL